MSFVNQFEIGLGNDQGNHDLGCVFCECFPQANSLTTKKGSEAERVTLLPIWPEIVRTLGTESLWNELVMILPFVLVVVKSIHVNLKHMIISYSISTKVNRFSDHKCRCDFERRVNS